MKRHQSLVAFSHHHHKALLLSQVLIKNSPPFKSLPNTPETKLKYLLNNHLDLLIYHFDLEEKLLFPFIQKITDRMNSIIDRILSEHKLVFNLIQKAKENLDLENTLDSLGKTLNAHIRFEERVLFEMIQKHLSSSELAELEKITSKIDSGNSCKI